MELLIPVLTLTLLGLSFGVSLALAAKKFCVSSDKRLEMVLQVLPGVNCGACGMPGCCGFAESLISGSCGMERCSVMGQESRIKIAEILGIAFQQKEKLVAVCHCNGGKNRVKDKFEYNGIKDCVSANLVMSGPKECSYGCLGFGTCVQVCPFGAISLSPDDLPVVDASKCKACNRCVEICPKGLFSLVPEKTKVLVACRSQDIAKITKGICSLGCIGCRLCQKTCKFDAIKVVGNVAVIDYQKCTSCLECVKVCPVKCIQLRKI